MTTFITIFFILIGLTFVGFIATLVVAIVQDLKSNDNVSPTVSVSTLHPTKPFEFIRQNEIKGENTSDIVQYFDAKNDFVILREKISLDGYELWVSEILDQTFVLKSDISDRTNTNETSFSVSDNINESQKIAVLGFTSFRVYARTSDKSIEFTLENDNLELPNKSIPTYVKWVTINGKPYLAVVGNTYDGPTVTSTIIYFYQDKSTDPDDSLTFKPTVEPAAQSTYAISNNNICILNHVIKKSSNIKIYPFKDDKFQNTPFTLKTIDTSNIDLMFLKNCFFVSNDIIITAQSDAQSDTPTVQQLMLYKKSPDNIWENSDVMLIDLTHNIEEINVSNNFKVLSSAILSDIDGVKMETYINMYNIDLETATVKNTQTIVQDKEHPFVSINNNYGPVVNTFDESIYTMYVPVYKINDLNTYNDIMTEKYIWTVS
jgi:hypothetical protein